MWVDSRANHWQTDKPVILGGSIPSLSVCLENMREGRSMDKLVCNSFEINQFLPYKRSMQGVLRLIFRAKKICNISSPHALNCFGSRGATTPLQIQVNQALHSQTPVENTSVVVGDSSNGSSLPPQGYSPPRSVANEKRNLVYCHALPAEWDERKLRAYFDISDEHIVSIRLLRNRIGGYTGRAMIEFRNEVIADRYLEKYGDTFLDTQDVLQRIIMKPFALKTKKTRL